jgi:hypothetical protein
MLSTNDSPNVPTIIRLNVSGDADYFLSEAETTIMVVKMITDKE